MEREDNMSMKLMSEILLEREIKRLEDDGIPEDSDILYYLYKKELEVIKKLKISKIDMRGEVDEFNHRIDNQEIYFMDPGEFEAMRMKAKGYDIIAGFIKNNSPE